MTASEFDRALSRTALSANARTVQAARLALVGGISVYRAALGYGITQVPVHVAARKIIAAAAMTHCDKCGHELT